MPQRRKTERYNATFSIGSDYSLNACVGENGEQDHRKYGFGYDEAVKVMIAALTTAKMVVDAGVYPLVFCARHRIELFIKDQLLTFERIRPRKEITDEILNKTHDLGNLWETFKDQAAKTDRRTLPFIKKAEPYICDFAEIDPTGATFRYPYDKSQTLHLDNTPIINIQIFAKRYHKLSALLNSFEHLTEYLVDEYGQGTFTNQLSRDDLRDISLELPHVSEWTDSCFNIVRNDLKNRYEISSNELSRAINLIKDHREFSSNIGVNIPLKGLDHAALKAYADIYHEYHSRISSQSATAKTKRSLERRLVGKVSTNLPKSAITAIYTLYELGKLSYFSESYDSLFDRYYQQEYELQFFCSYILRSRRALEFIRRGLEKVAQIELLSEIPEKGKQVGQPLTEDRTKIPKRTP